MFIIKRDLFVFVPSDQGNGREKVRLFRRGDTIDPIDDPVYLSYLDGETQQDPPKKYFIVNTPIRDLADVGHICAVPHDATESDPSYFIASDTTFIPVVDDEQLFVTNTGEDSGYIQWGDLRKALQSAGINLPAEEAAALDIVKHTIFKLEDDGTWSVVPESPEIPVTK